MITVTLPGNDIIAITNADLKAFERKLVSAAKAKSEVEVNVKNEQRGYILFGNWDPTSQDEGETAAAFASCKVSLVLDGVAGIASLKKVYAVYAPDFPNTIRFAFNAIDEAEAQDKIWKWNRYHSFTGRDQNTIREVSASDIHPGFIHNEYL